MKKAVLTKEQADAVESALIINKKHGNDPSSIISWKVNDLFTHDEEPINTIKLDTLIRALYVGYEVEVPESYGDDVMGDEVIKGDYILEHDGEMILETNAIDYLVDFLGAVRKVAGE